MSAEQLNQPLIFTALFLAGQFGKTGMVVASTLTVDVYNPAGTRIINNAVPNEIGGGLYTYTLANSNVTSAGQYLALFKSTDATCTPQQISDRYQVGSNWLQNIDVATSSRSLLSAAGVWGYVTRNLTDYGVAQAAPNSTPVLASITGGGSTGGLLPTGTYSAKYTWVNSAGETTASPALQFTLSVAGNIPQLTIPSLPTGIIYANLYLTAPNSPTGTETLYISGVTGTTINLAVAPAGGTVVAVMITNQGSGYSSPPTVSFSGGSGSGAAATAAVSGGLITAITITNPGSGYTSQPTITFTGGSGSNAAATAFIISSTQTVPTVNSTNSLLNSFWTATNRTLTSFGFNVTVGSNTDKNGYKLDPTGLDQIPITDPGVITSHTTLPKMLIALWRYTYKQTTATQTLLKTYKDDNTTVNVSMSLGNDGTTQTKGAGA